MNKVDLYINGTRADAFQDESITLNLTTQNISDIGKVFGEFSQTFSLPATKVNNGIFSHYYNVDVSGGFNANVRVDAVLEVNTILFREGVVELEGVQFKNGEPYSYNVSFYGKTASLKDAFGDDQLTDLDLSAYDHPYNDTYIRSGIDGYVTSTSSSIIYPLISSSHNWYYSSDPTDTNIDNIHYNNPLQTYGVQYYDLKPAIKVKAVLDAIEAKYGVTFNSDLFDSANFAKLFMWCHRKEGYMFKNQLDSYPSKLVNFQTGTNFDLVKDSYEVSAAIAADGRIRVDYTLSFISGSECELYAFVNGVKRVTVPITGNTTAQMSVFDLNEGDLVSFQFAPKPDWGGGALEISLNVTGKEYGAPFATIFTASTTGLLQTYTNDVVIADQMPEQKVSDFITGLIKMFNLVVIYEGKNTYKLQPLNDWYADGSTYDITNYVDTSSFSANRPELYRRIKFSYEKTGALIGEIYRNTSGGGIGYGDLRADFTYDGGDFEIQSTFDHFLFERLVDEYSGRLSNVAVGKSIDKDLEPYIGEPYIFYAPDINSLGGTPVAYINTGATANTFGDAWMVSNCNAIDANNVTETLNFGTEIDPYTLVAQTGGLYEVYWQDYITDLYSTARRIFKFEAVLPLRVMLQLKTNDKLTIVDRDYIINNVTLDLTSSKAQLELLNDV